MSAITLQEGDCLQVLAQLHREGVRVHAIVCDPPYELTSPKKGLDPRRKRKPRPGSKGAGFMGAKWDATQISFRPAVWRLCYELLLPGGHLIAFGGSRTIHKITTAIEMAGFEIRDQLGWLYGNGLSKSRNISKAIDDRAGAERKVVGKKISGLHNALCGVGKRRGQWGEGNQEVDVTVPTTPDAIKWDDWHTQLKPAHEPICLARRPIAPGLTVEENVLRFATGAMNIGACRVGTSGGTVRLDTVKNRKRDMFGMGSGTIGHLNKGRFPPNILHDGSPEVLAMFERAGQGKSVPRLLRSGKRKLYGLRPTTGPSAYGVSDEGSPARFFYCPKAAGDDRVSEHPTIKPVAVMDWLVRLVTPPGGLLLDPFAGTGTTGVAAQRLGLECILIEKDPEHAATIRKRFGLK